MPESVGDWLGRPRLKLSTCRGRGAAQNASMDDIVKQAIAKWPNVPHCYGWLGLDARGDWYLRDDRTQAPARSRGPKARRSSTRS